jgi:hypothetical protein
MRPSVLQEITTADVGKHDRHSDAVASKRSYGQKTCSGSRVHPKLDSQDRKQSGRQCGPSCDDWRNRNDAQTYGVLPRRGYDGWRAWLPPRQTSVVAQDAFAQSFQIAGSIVARNQASCVFLRPWEDCLEGLYDEAADLFGLAVGVKAPPRSVPGNHLGRGGPLRRCPSTTAQNPGLGLLLARRVGHQAL